LTIKPAITPSITPPVTPMMRQYLEIKDSCRDAILFFRLGDFYEMFFDDAIEASKILEITLTTRNKNDPNPVPLCGIPHHSASSYIAKLVESGRKVAICEQVEDPKEAKGVVKRAIVRIVTPGLVVDEASLGATQSNYLAAVIKDDKCWGLAFLDLSTGDFRVTEIEDSTAGLSQSLMDELLKIEPRELLFADSFKGDSIFNELSALLNASISSVEDHYFNTEEGIGVILEQFKLSSLDGLGCDGMSVGIGAAAAILKYVRDSQGGMAGHIDRLSPYHISSFMLIDSATKRNLELTSTMLEDNKKGSLFHALDFTETAMGGRRLKEWINYPPIIPVCAFQ